MAMVILLLCGLAFGYLVAIINELTLPRSRRILLRQRRSRFGGRRR